MSYDFVLFKPRDGEDPLVTAQQCSQDFPATPPDPQIDRIIDPATSFDESLSGYTEVMSRMYESPPTR